MTIWNRVLLLGLLPFPAFPILGADPASPARPEAKSVQVEYRALGESLRASRRAAEAAVHADEPSAARRKRRREWKQSHQADLQRQEDLKASLKAEALRRLPPERQAEALATAARKARREAERETAKRATAGQGNARKDPARRETTLAEYLQRHGVVPPRGVVAPSALTAPKQVPPRPVPSAESR